MPAKKSSKRRKPVPRRSHVKVQLVQGRSFSYLNSYYGRKLIDTVQIKQKARKILVASGVPIEREIIDPG
jgi:hypothetical protein